MRALLATPHGYAIYALRKQSVEPVFGQIKEVRGLRRFRFRGLPQVEREWKLICATHNLLKLFRYRAGRLPLARPAAAFRGLSRRLIHIFSVLCRPISAYAPNFRAPSFLPPAPRCAPSRTAHAV